MSDDKPQEISRIELPENHQKGKVRILRIGQQGSEQDWVTVDEAVGILRSNLDVVWLITESGQTDSLPRESETDE